MSKQYSFLIIVFFTSCLWKKSTFDENGRIEKLGTPLKLEYYAHKQDEAFLLLDTVTFIITEKSQLQSAIEEIKNADNPQPWKGAGWNRIKIYYSDTILIINTNAKKIGLSNSGLFYDLSESNFITKRINQE